MPKFELLGVAQEIGAGSMKAYKTSAGEVLVVNVGGSFYAISNVCTHAKELLNNGMLVGTQVVCPAHFAVFDVCDGKVARHPQEAEIAPIKTFTVTVQEGNLFLDVDAES